MEPYPFLKEKHRAVRGNLDQSGNEKEQPGKGNDTKQTAKNVKKSFEK